MGLVSYFFGGTNVSGTSGGWFPLGAAKTSAGIDVTHSSALTYSAAWAATQLLSASGSMLPLNLMQRNGRETGIATDHPLQRILHYAPNPDMTSMMFRTQGIAQQVNWGITISEVMTDNGRPVSLGGRVESLEPIHAGRINKIDRDDRGEVYYKIRKRESAQFDDIPANRIFRVPSSMSNDGITGLGVITHAKESIAMGLATEKQGAEYFKNGARPLIVMRGKFKTADDRDSFRRQWSEIHGENARPAVAPPEITDIDKLSFPPEDSQFLQTRQHNVEEVARWYRVPTVLLNDMRQSTFNNVSELNRHFVTYSLMPWLKLWEEHIWLQLLNPIEQQTYFAKHNVNAFARGDMAARQAYYVALFGIGAISINEIRELEDYNPIDGGDEHFVAQNNLAPLSDVLRGETPEERSESAQEAMLMLTDIKDSVSKPLTVSGFPGLEDVSSSLDSLTTKVERLGVSWTEPVSEWFQLEVKRVVTNEVKAIRKASKEPDTFVDRIESFYRAHAEHVAKAIEKPAKHLSRDPVAYAEAHVEDSRGQILSACDGSPGGFEARINELCERWTETRHKVA